MVLKFVASTRHEGDSCCSEHYSVIHYSYYQNPVMNVKVSVRGNICKHGWDSIRHIMEQKCFIYILIKFSKNIIMVFYLVFQKHVWCMHPCFFTLLLKKIPSKYPSPPMDPFPRLLFYSNAVLILSVWDHPELDLLCVPADQPSLLSSEAIFKSMKTGLR